jgi:hypothetical protein
MVADSIRWNKERKSGRRGEEEGNPDTCGHGVSVGEVRKARARVSWASGGSLGSAQADAGKGEETGRARERRAGRTAELGRNRIGEEIPFLFLFPLFQSIFQKDFESSFEFDSNHSIQNFKCSSMSAQTCSYPYI